MYYALRDEASHTHRDQARRSDAHRLLYVQSCIRPPPARHPGLSGRDEARNLRSRGFCPDDDPGQLSEVLARLIGRPQLRRSQEKPHAHADLSDLPAADAGWR